MSSSSRVSAAIHQSSLLVQPLGIPDMCACGEKIVKKTSNSEANPYRRYFRCAYAARLNLVNDKHLFKWIDEGILEEFESYSTQAESSEKLLIMDFDSKMRGAKKLSDAAMEQLRQDFEAKLVDVVEEVNGRMKIALVVVFIGFLIMYAMLKC